jgi:hypothetical protein
MTTPSFDIKYDGGDADDHAIDMRLLGASLQGFERIISDGIVVLTTRRLPKRGERAYLRVKAQESVQGSHSVPSIIAENAGLLQLGWSFFNLSGPEFVSKWVEIVLTYWSGKKDLSEKLLDSLMETQRLNLAARGESEMRNLASRDESERRWHEENAEWRKAFLTLALRSQPAAQNAVAPVGPSVRQVSLLADACPPIEIDEADADAIRSKGELDVSDLQTVILTADGWIYHSRLLNVHHPEKPGKYIQAKVRDPLGEVDGNVYADAAMDRATIMVQAKLARRGDELESIYIMDYVRRYDNAA